eukprot:SAG11_NODE_54_length_19571_cov_29.437786_14_plen_263_part_00
MSARAVATPSKTAASGPVGVQRRRRRVRRLTGAKEHADRLLCPSDCSNALHMHQRLRAARRRLVLVFCTVKGQTPHEMPAAVVARICARMSQFGCGQRLRRAAALGDADALKLELKLGVDVNEKDGELCPCDLLISDSQYLVGRSLFVAACASTGRGGVALVGDEHHPVRQRGDLMPAGATALHYAACHERVECLLLLLGAAAVDIESCTSSGETPLHYAAHSGSLRVVEELLRAGADAVDARRIIAHAHLVTILELEFAKF